MTLGEKIKKARKNAKLTQRELATMIGVSQAAITQIESDKARPSTNNLRRIASALESMDLLTLDWDDEILDTVDDSTQIQNDEKASLSNFLIQHGANVYSRKDINKVDQINYYISFDGKTYTVPVEIYDNLHNHLYSVCKEFIKALSAVSVSSQQYTRVTAGVSDLEIEGG